jgi:hypothetical protein
MNSDKSPPQAILANSWQHIPHILRKSIELLIKLQIRAIMVGGQPFMYDPVPKETSQHPYHSFNPKAVSRASLTPEPTKPKQDGPLVSFNQHPE